METLAICARPRYACLLWVQIGGATSPTGLHLHKPSVGTCNQVRRWLQRDHLHLNQITTATIPLIQPRLSEEILSARGSIWEQRTTANWRLVRMCWSIQAPYSNTTWRS